MVLFIPEKIKGEEYVDVARLTVLKVTGTVNSASASPRIIQIYRGPSLPVASREILNSVGFLIFKGRKPRAMKRRRETITL